MKTEEKKGKALNADHKKEIIKLLKEAAYSKDIAQVFNDFLEMTAITLSNQIDFISRDKRESRYMEIIKSYGEKQQKLFPEMFVNLVWALEDKAQTVGTEDILGVIFHELELHDIYKGQFFTPQHISDFMALVTCGDETQTAIKEQGYITALEPCCGSGVMITSFCKAMKKNNMNYQNQLVVTAVDIDIKCVHMTYIQLALYGVPAVVIHGNSLTTEEFSRWYTPLYILNGWVWRQRCGITAQYCASDEILKRASEPMYAAFRQIEALIADTPIEANLLPEENTVETSQSPEKPAPIVINKPEPTLYEVGEQLSLFEP